MTWIAAELPPEIPAACVQYAADYYSEPPALLVAILQVEGGKSGRAYVRSHGTYYGPGQISDKWLPKFESWGYTAAQLQHNPCANVMATAYVLSYYWHREKSWNRAVARYNVGSLVTPVQIDAGSRYATKVMTKWWAIYSKWK